MTLFLARRDPTVSIQVNGQPALEYEQARLRFRYIDKIYKRDEAELELADPVRKFRDQILTVDDFFLVTWGYPGNMSRPRGLKLKTWTTVMDNTIGAVKLKLQVTSARPISKSKKAQVPSEPHKTHIATNWGRISSSKIARKIARRHRLKFRGDESDDNDRTDFVQPINVSDYGYLRRLAENIDFEFFIEQDTLYYRKKPYEEAPRRIITYLPAQKDSLLLSFQPDVKVTTVRSSPASVDVEQGEHPWSATRQTAVELAALVFKKDKDKIEEGIDLLTDQAELGWQQAETLKEVLRTEFTPEAAKDVEDANKALTGVLILLADQKREAREAQKPVDKQARANRTRKFLQNDMGGITCPKGQQLEGNETTGNSESSQGLLLDLKNQGKSRIGATGLAGRLGIKEWVVQVTDSTTKQRVKKACASHSKKKDRAVTARAEFWGDPELRAKVVYRFENVGRLFNGNWYSKEAVHDLPTGAYTITMQLKRGSLRSKKKGKGEGKKDKKKVDKAKNELVRVLNTRTAETFIAVLPKDLPKPKVASK